MVEIRVCVIQWSQKISTPKFCLHTLEKGQESLPTIFSHPASKIIAEAYHSFNLHAKWKAWVFICVSSFFNKHAAARRLQFLLVTAVKSQYDVEATALRMGYNITATNTSQMQVWDHYAYNECTQSSRTGGEQQNNAQNYGTWVVGETQRQTDNRQQPECLPVHCQTSCPLSVCLCVSPTTRVP